MLKRMVVLVVLLCFQFIIPSKIFALGLEKCNLKDIDYIIHNIDLYYEYKNIMRSVENCNDLSVFSNSEIGKLFLLKTELGKSKSLTKPLDFIKINQSIRDLKIVLQNLDRNQDRDFFAYAMQDLSYFLFEGEGQRHSESVLLESLNKQLEALDLLGKNGRIGRIRNGYLLLSNIYFELGKLNNSYEMYKNAYDKINYTLKILNGDKSNTFFEAQLALGKILIGLGSVSNDISFYRNSKMALDRAAPGFYETYDTEKWIQLQLGLGDAIGAQALIQKDRSIIDIVLGKYGIVISSYRHNKFYNEYAILAEFKSTKFLFDFANMEKDITYFNSSITLIKSYLNYYDQNSIEYARICNYIGILLSDSEGYGFDFSRLREAISFFETAKNLFSKLDMEKYKLLMMYNIESAYLNLAEEEQNAKTYEYIEKKYSDLIVLIGSNDFLNLRVLSTIDKNYAAVRKFAINGNAVAAKRALEELDAAYISISPSSLTKGARKRREIANKAVDELQGHVSRDGRDSNSASSNP